MNEYILAYDLGTSGVKAAIAGAGISSEEVVGVSCGTQGIGFIPVDAEGNALYNNITWIDSRSLEQAEQMNARAVEKIAKTMIMAKVLGGEKPIPEAQREPLAKIAQGIKQTMKQAGLAMNQKHE